MQRVICDQCLRSLTILLVVIMVVLAGILTPWWMKMRFYSEHIETMSNQIVRFESMLARHPQLEAQLGQMRQQLATSDYFLEAANPALAAADLQQRVRRVIESNGGQLVSTQNLTSPANDELIEVIIRVRMTGGIESLGRALYELEGGSPLLLVDNLGVRSNKRYLGRGQNRVVEFHQDVNFDLIGFLQRRG